MKRFILLSAMMLAFISGYGQVALSLLPDNMKNYVGKVTQKQFEEVVGSSLHTDESGVVTYEVKNSYDDEVTAIRCFYRQKDNKLIAVMFGTPHYLGYWIKFGEFKGYNEKLHCKTTKVAGTLTKVELKLNGFGCQILDITKVAPQRTTAVINYHLTD